MVVFDLVQARFEGREEGHSAEGEIGVTHQRLQDNNSMTNPRHPAELHRRRTHD